ncbi:MAG: hypothetical protein HQL94_06650 [Magnetococcales bacterium]|nr:hypothetical protein [Magnetococcales bacterium]
MFRFFKLILFLMGLVLVSPLVAATGEEMVPELPNTITTVAVWDFDSASMPGMAEAASMDYLAKAIPEMIVAKLVNGSDLKIVERVQLQETLAEQKLGSGDMTDPKARIQLGRVSGARFMVFGSYMILGPMVQVSVRVVNSETSLMTFVDTKEGPSDTLPTLLNDLATSVTASFIRGDLSTTSFGWNQDLALWKRQEQGLQLLDQRKYKEAATIFDTILKDKPDFLPAQRQAVMARVGSSYQQGMDLMQSGKGKEAVEIFKKILKDNPQFQPARNRLKEALQMKRQSM